MEYVAHSPGPPLSEFVDRFWLISGGHVPRKERILPSGTIELVINLHEDEMRIHDPEQPDKYKRFSGAIVSGTYSRVFLCDAQQHKSILGVHFKPGGAAPFLGAPASELTDTHANLLDLWGRPARQLRERLCEQTKSQDKFRVVEEALSDRLRSRPLKRHQALPIALGMFGPEGTGASVRDVAREVGLCQRRFIQVFTDQVGLRPKQFCRLLRFQRARTLAGNIDWARLASICGYFDQSHLIHDFLEFSGLNPSEYLRQQPADERLLQNHVPLAR